MSHFLLMVVYAAVLGLFFALLTRRRFGDRARLFLVLFGSLVGGGLALAWLMYFFPSGPPAPIP